MGIAFLCAFRCAPECFAAPRGNPPELQPAVRIPVAPFGYLAPNSFYLTYRFSSASLSFLNDDHLLFTFRAFGLLRRLRSDQRGDADQEIRALVFDLRTGKVVRQTQWRLHDRDQYLWPLPGGKVLLRIRNTLYLTDQSLVLHPYLTFPSEIESIQLSPSGRLMIVERSQPPGVDIASAPSLEQATPLMVDILAPGSTQDLITSQMPSAAALPLMGDGLLDVLQSNREADWTVRFVPFRGPPHVLANMKSQCRPDVQPLSETAALIMGCYSSGDSRTVVAISTADGSELWQNQWDNKYVWGWFTYADNGSRFAYESLEVNRPISAFDALDPQAVTAQMVGVYDTDSGKLVLVRDASPVLSAGQNAALSPDGTRFAILRHGAIEVYNLPPVQPPGPKSRKK
jgi:hypothetical protein